MHYQQGIGDGVWIDDGITSAMGVRVGSDLQHEVVRIPSNEVLASLEDFECAKISQRAVHETYSLVGFPDR